MVAQVSEENPCVDYGDPGTGESAGIRRNADENARAVTEEGHTVDGDGGDGRDGGDGGDGRGGRGVGHGQDGGYGWSSGGDGRLRPAEVGAVGGFFALRIAPRPPAPPGAHVPLARVYAGDTAPLTARVDKVAARLRAPDRRIAASVAQLGLAARLWSIALGSAVLTGAVPDLDPERLHWDPDLTSPEDLWLAGPRALPGTARTVREVVRYGHLVPLAEALRRDGRISPRLLWGNAGSALAGAVRELSAWGERNGRPEVAERAGALAAELFDDPDLRGTGDRVAGAYRRRSCCLYYRCPAGGLCGDCVFDRPPLRSADRPYRPSSPPSPQRSSARTVSG